uniref:Purple acid phosphatase n=1 Tax=Sarcoptes scabiei TaxID=52283 RepID=A0A834R677_SARSC
MLISLKISHLTSLLLFAIVFYSSSSESLVKNFYTKHSHKSEWLPVFVQPEQIHLSIGAHLNERVVTWTTFNSTPQSKVHFGRMLSDHHDTPHIAIGSYEIFTDGGNEKRSMFIHRVYLRELEPDTLYWYRCGSSKGWSETFFFKTFPMFPNWSPRFAVYGDLGNDNGQSFAFLEEQIQMDDYDIVAHIGDLAYDLHTDNARVGDEFMRQIQPIAGYVPYQTVPGNHERAYTERLAWSAKFRELLYKYGVDLAIWGHDHIYTRFWPTFDEEIYKGSEKEPYRNPKAPVHIISGSAGCREFVTPVCPKPNKFTAYASSDYGFMGIHFINHTHIHMEQFSINRKGQVIDEFYLIKDEQRTYFSY